MNHGIYCFGTFELEPAERRLSQGGRRIALTPKVFDTLVLLVERAGHIVTKDELMRALWPRGYVEESNLTKHIWLIRRALGESENDASAIETVPKIGYRFVAPLTLKPQPAATPAAPVAAAVDTGVAPPLEPRENIATPALSASASSTWQRSRVVIAACALVVVVAVALFALRHTTSASHEVRAVALVGFNNLSGNPKDAWVAPALAEMLQGELGAARGVQVVPSELVRSASIDLALPSAGGYATATLGRLRQRLKADYVISGSYLVSSFADDAPIRIDIALQDTRGGALLASVSRRSNLHDLMSVASDAGATLREKLGLQATDSDTRARVAKLTPASVDVTRRMGFALDAMEHYDPARARDELLQAIAEAPGYAPAYTYLSQAWESLGYHAKSLAAAEQAAASSADLPPEQRLQTQAVVSTARGDWAQAAHQWNALVTLRPEDIDYRLHAVDAEIAAGTATEARSGVTALRTLAPSDPRVELAASRLEGALDDAKASEQAAAKALEQAQTRDAVGLIADAQVLLAGAHTHLNENEAARAGLLQAIEAYRAIRNPRGEAAARNDLAQALGNLNRNQEAREEFQRAMALDQSIGDLAGEAGVYRNLCEMLWTTGDRDGAQAAAHRALELGRQIGDVPMQYWTLQALATIQSDDEASDEVLQEYREVVDLNQRAGHQTVWPLTNIADLQRMRGELEAAHSTCDQARAQAMHLTDPQFAMFSTFTCGLITTDQGDTAQARTLFIDAQHRAQAAHNDIYLWNSQMMLAQLALDEGRWSDACDGFTKARDGFATGEERTGEADASALLAQCEQGRGDFKARDAALGHATQLRRAMTSRQEVYQVDITVAQLGGSGSNAVRELQRLARDAEQRRFVCWALEAQLAAWRVAQSHTPSQAAELRAALEARARKLGYGRILRLLAMPASKPAAKVSGS